MSLELLTILDADGKAQKGKDPNLPKDTLLFLYEQMVQVREFDRRMLMLQRQGRIDDAVLAFNEAMALDPNNGVAVMSAANTQANQRNYDESTKLFRRAQTMQLPDLVKRLAFIRWITDGTNAGNCDVAAEALDAARKSPVFDPLRFVEREAFMMARCDYEEARGAALLAKHVALHPDNERLANGLQTLHFGRPENRYRELGIQVSRDAIAADVKDLFIFSSLATALVEVGRIEEAREIAGRAVQTRTIFVGPSRMQRAADAFEARIHYQQKEYAKADEIYRRLVAAQPWREVREFSGYGRLKLAMNQYDEAAAVYNDGLKRLPRSCQLWQELGTVYATKGDVATALATFDKGIAAVPKCGLNYNEAARLLIKQNRVPEAKQKLDALIKIAPNSDGAVIAKEILAGMGK